MRYWEHPDWPAMAAAVREAGDWGPAADWIEEVCNDEVTAARVRTLAQADSSHPAWWAAAKVLADGCASNLIPGVDHRPVEVMELQRTVLVGELYLAIQNGFVHRVVATGRHLAALHQICLREPVAEVLVCGPLWMTLDGPAERSWHDPKSNETVLRFDASLSIPGWEGGGLFYGQEMVVSDLERLQDRTFAAQQARLRAEAFRSRLSPESLLARSLVPPGPRVEWARQADDGFYRPPPPGASPFFPERQAIHRWDRIARWHAQHPDGGDEAVFPADHPYGNVLRGAVADRGGYTLLGVALEHTTVRR